MTYLICRVKVRDYAEWREVFDSHYDAQLASGLKLKRVLRNIDNPIEVFSYFEVMDLEGARGFVTSADVPDAIEQSGVIDTPDVWIVEAV